MFTLALLDPAQAVASGIVRVGQYVIPSAFTRALESGMTVPVFLRNRDLSGRENDQKIADAVITLNGGQLSIQRVELIEDTSGARLAAETRALVEGLSSRVFADDTKIELSADATLQLDVASFYLTLNVSQEALAAALIPRSGLLGPSSVTGVTATLDYDLGIYNSYIRDSGSTTSNYLSLNNNISWKEHHLNFNGSLYGIGTGSQDGTFYRAMYERDYEGRRVALGMVDTWNLQSLGSVSALNSSKIYGFSYGNEASTKVQNTSLSLNPVTVYLPSTGEVHIFREGKLLSIQNFPMGSFEVDTSRLPYGLYDVDVEVIADGKLISRTRQRINKAFSRTGTDLKEIAWQVYGGYMEFDSFSERQRRFDEEYNERYRTYESKDTYLVGASAATRLPVLDGLSVRTSAYAFDSNVVNETDFSLTVNEDLSVNLQTLIGSDSSWRYVANISTSLPGDFASVWVGKEYSSIGDDLPMYQSDSYSYGTSVNLNKLTTLSRAGSLNYTYSNDRYYNYSTENIEYATSLFSGRFGNVGLRAGMQRFRQRQYDQNDTQKYISLDFTIPLGNMVSLGFSRQGGDTKANLNVNKTISDSVITAVGMSASQTIHSDDGRNDSLSTSGYMSFDGKYSQGNLVASHPAGGQWNANLTARGSLAVSGSGIAASSQQNGAGVIVKTDIEGNGALAAKVNGRSYTLTRGNNFIPLSPYGEYEIELMNDKNSMDSFEIVRGKKMVTTLYPGNVDVLSPELNQLVTVFGRVLLPSGNAAAHTDIKNHIGKSVTDSNGGFAMDVDKRHPVIFMLLPDSQVCEAELDLKRARGVYWAGDITCRPQQLVSEVPISEDVSS